MKSFEIKIKKEIFFIEIILIFKKKIKEKVRKK
jgi:hypothetical protein